MNYNIAYGHTVLRAPRWPVILSLRENNPLTNHHIMKRTPKFDKAWSESIAMLPAELQQPLTDAIREYQKTGAGPAGLHPIAQCVFNLLKPVIDRRAKAASYQRRRRGII